MVNKVCYSIIVPMYNEEAVIQEAYRRLKSVMSSTGETYELIFNNDGSKDRSASIVQEYGYWDETVKLIDFSRKINYAGSRYFVFGGARSVTHDNENS